MVKKTLFVNTAVYFCLKCDKHVDDRQPGILCNISNLWVQRSCAAISKKEYEDLQNSDNEMMNPCTVDHVK